MLEPHRRALRVVWRSLVRIERLTSATSSCWASPGSTATTCTGSRAGRPRAAARSSSGRGRRLDRRPDARRRSTPGPASTSTAAARTSSPAAWSSSPTSRRPAVPARPGAADAVPITPRRAVALRRPSRRPRPAPVHRGPRGPRHGGGRTARSTTRSSRSPSTAATSTRPRRAAPDFDAAPRLSPDGSQLAWLEWHHPNMPWDGTELRFAPIGRGRQPRRAGARRRQPGRLDRPAALVARRHAPLLSDRSGWMNLYRLVEGPRLEPLAPIEAEFADPAWLFGCSSYGFLPDGSDRRRRPARRPRPALSTSAPGTRIGQVETPFTRARCPAGRAGRDRRAGRCPDRSLGRRPARSADARACRRPAPGEHGHPRPGGRSRCPRPSSSRRPAGGPRTPCSTRRRTPRSSRPRGSARRSSC